MQHRPLPQIRFGSRGAGAPADQVRTHDVRRGVAALGSLSRGHRDDPAARAACLFYALRSDTGGRAIQALMHLVDTRVAAFEWMIANRPHLVPRDGATAAYEEAVYALIATEPLVSIAGRQRFDSARFAAQLERVLARPAARTSIFAPGMAAAG